MNQLQYNPDFTALYIYGEKNEVISLDIKEQDKLLDLLKKDNDDDVPLYLVSPSDLGAVGIYRIFQNYYALATLKKIRILIFQLTKFLSSETITKMLQLYALNIKENKTKEEEMHINLLRTSVVKTTNELDGDYISTYLIDNGIKITGYIFNRIYERFVIDYVKELKTHNIKIIMDNDDLIHDLPDFNFIKRHLKQNSRVKNFLDALKLADKLTVSTKYLQEELNKLNKRNDIFIMPNMVSINDIGESGLKSINNQLEWFNNNNENRVMRILYAGSNTHIGDLGKYRNLFVEIAEDPRYKFVFMGYVPEFMKGYDIEYKGWINFNPKIYFSELTSLNCQVSIIPLVEHSFNKAKSNIKLIEMSALGIPSICSKFPYSPYENAPLSFNFKSRYDIIKTLDKLYSNKEFFKEQVNKSLAYYNNFCFEANIQRLNDLLDYISS